MRFGSLAGVAAFALAASVAGTAVAQPAGSTAKADELFNQGRTLLEAGKFKLACIKFQQSLDEADALGTRLNLALCMEKRGRIFTAMQKFEDTAERAKRAGDPDSEKAARDHVDQLRPMIPTITVTLTAPVPPGAKIVITRPDEPDQPVSDGSAVQLDPTDPNDPADKLVVRVSAPGHVDQTVEQVVLAPKQKLAVTVPVLAAATDANRPPPPPPKSRRKLYAIGLGVAGVGLMVGGGLWAVSLRNDQEDACAVNPPAGECDFTGSRLTKVRFGATGMFAAGAIAVGVGAYLFFTAPKSREASEGTAVVPTVSPESAGIAVLGHF